MMQRGLISESDPLAGAVVDDDAAVDDDGKKELSSPKTIVEEIAKNGLQVTWHWSANFIGILYESCPTCINLQIIRLI